MKKTDQLSFLDAEGSPTPSTKPAALRSTPPRSQLAETSRFETPVESSPVEAAPSAEPQILSVSDLNRMVKGQLEGQFRSIYVKGEVSNFKPHSSGHYYFSLKDQKSQISAVMFKGFNAQLKFRLQDGMEVIARGKISVYEPRGSYQIFCEALDPVGAGALQLAYEQLKNKLKAEGLFDTARKRPLPALPQRLGLITSPTGAAIQDMMNVLKRRYRLLDVTLIPTSVQGASAAKEIVRAIETANRLGQFDVLIVGRGGGSIEDLWSFNEEIVARAISASRIPIVSAVGHEVDFTIADFVADLRAPTPSAAAELVVPSTEDLQDRIRRIQAQARQSVAKKLEVARHQYLGLSKRLIDPKRKLQDLMLRCDEMTDRLQSAVLRTIERLQNRKDLLRSRMLEPGHHIKLLRQRLELAEGKMNRGLERTLTNKQAALSRLASVLDSLSPLRVVERGFSIVKLVPADPQSASSAWPLLTRVEQVTPGQDLQIRLKDGHVQAVVSQIDKFKS